MGRDRVVLGLLVLLAALLAASFVARAVAGPGSALPFSFTALVLAEAVPIGLALLLSKGPRGLALALVVGFAAVALPASAAFVASGPLVTNALRETTSAGLLASLLQGMTLPVQILLLGAAFLARRSLPAAQRRGRDWLLGAAVPLGLHALAVALPIALSGDRATGRRFEANRTAAREAVASVVRCAAEHATRAPQLGFPTREALLAGGCVAPDVARGEGHGYRFAYLPGVAGDDGRIDAFAVCAQPISLLRTGVFTIVSDDTGKAAEYVPRTAEDLDAGRALPCADVWFFEENDAWRGLRHCLLAFADAHPDQGYPPTLREIGPLGDACVPDLVPLTPAGEIVGGGLRYRPGPPDAGGRIRRFALEIEPPAPAATR